MVLLQWQPVADVLVNQAQWLDDGATVVVGGWQQWPDQCAVLIYGAEDAGAQLCPDVVSPHFAVAPTGRRIAYWRRVAMEQGAAAELSVLDLAGPVISTLGAPRSINAGMHLAWLSDQQILFTFQRDETRTGTLFVADLRGGAPVEVMRREDGVWQALNQMPGPTAASEFLTAAGLLRDHVCLMSSGQVQITPLEPLGGIEPSSFDMDAEGQLIFNKSASEGAIIDQDVSSFCVSPDERAVIYTKAHKLMTASVEECVPRCVKSMPDAHFALSGCSWSPATSNVCVWGKAGNSGRLWYGLLGTEQITGRFEFDADSQVAVGSRLWIAKRFQLDERGGVVEPDWPTLKALFVVTRVLRGTNKVIAEAKSAGSEGGVVLRMTGSENPPRLEDSGAHIRIGVSTQPATEWLQSFRAKPLSDLAAWLQDTSEVGDPLTISVERRVLLPMGPQPQ